MATQPSPRFQDWVGSLATFARDHCSQQALARGGRNTFADAEANLRHSQDLWASFLDMIQGLMPEDSEMVDQPDSNSELPACRNNLPGCMALIRGWQVAPGT